MTLWNTLFAIALCLIYFINRHHDSTFFAFGPSDSLLVLEIPINTYAKYSTILAYIIANNFIRELQEAIIAPFLINTIQTFEPKGHIRERYAMQMVTVSTIYKWIDWFVSLQMILSQVDLLLVEIVSACLYSACTNHLYFTSTWTL